MKNGFCEPHAKIIFKKIIEGIKFCHDKKVCHLDIKPRNIVINKYFDPIIIDFGFSEEFNESTTFKKGKGSKRYISPEMWEEKEYDGVKSDIFSLGVVLFNLVTGICGFDISTVNDKYYQFIVEADSSGNYDNYCLRAAGLYSSSVSSRMNSPPLLSIHLLIDFSSSYAKPE